MKLKIRGKQKVLEPLVDYVEVEKAKQVELPTRMSASALKLWADCPASWVAKYISKSEKTVGTAAALGNAFDQTVSKILSGKVVDRDGKEVEVGEPTDKIATMLEAYRSHPKSWLHSTQTVQSQVAINITPEDWTKIAARWGCNPTLAYPILGYIDLFRQMDDGVRTELVDLKTSTQTTFRPEWTMQVILYAVATGATQAHIHLVTTTDKPKVLMKTIHLKAEDELVREVLNTVAYHCGEIKRVCDVKEFYTVPRKSGQHCFWCPLLTTCSTRGD